MNIRLDVMNAPDYAKDRKYVVATLDNGKLWFYGAYDELDKAEQAASTSDNRFILEVNY